MANEVVLGDLALDSRDDCLKFDGVNDYIAFPSTVVDFVRCKIIAESNIADSMILDNRLDGGTAFVVYNTSGVIYLSNCAMMINDVNVVNGTTVIPYGVELDIKIALSQSVINLFTRQSKDRSFKGLVWNLELQGTSDTYSYIQSGDFGSSTLIDHSGNGNNGTIHGAQWWKKGVDENYATPQLFKSTLVSPLTEDQNVIYTDATPYYPSDDVFWNPYNQDLTYSFTVSEQSESFSLLGIGSMKFDFKLSL